MRQHHSGFTLLEVMIALAIFGISALVVLQQTTYSVHQQTQLEAKTIALWAAENRFAELRLQIRWPDTGTRETQETLAQRQWRIKQSVEETANPHLRRVTVNVSRENQDAPLITLQGFLGEH